MTKTETEAFGKFAPGKAVTIRAAMPKVGVI